MVSVFPRRVGLLAVTAVVVVMMPPPASGNEPPPAASGEIAVELPAMAAASQRGGAWRVSEALPAGEAVLVGADWGGSEEMDAELRVRRDGEWEPWVPLEVVDEDDGPDPGTDEANHAVTTPTEPVWVGRVERLQVRVRGPRPVSELTLHTVKMGGGDDLVFDPLSTPGAAHAASTPNFIERSSWDPNDDCRPRSSPSYASNVNFAVVHHTAGSNDYSPAQSANIIRSICLYHRNTLGWNDIGYNIVVDRYGRTYEGRAGGLDRAVVGAHAAGYNTGSTGISVLGCFQSDQCTGDTNIPWAAVDAVDRALAWKFTIHGVEPHGTTSINSRTIPNIVGHRDVGSTACPGNRFYTYVRGSSPMADRVSGHMGAAIPVSGDWTGDGVTNVGWFQNGRWMLRMTNGSTVTFHYGVEPGDVPVTGDWNGNGRYGVGVHRSGMWYLRNSLSERRGLTAYAVPYGMEPGDVPVTGDWNGNGRYGVGVHRSGMWYLRNSLSERRGLTAYAVPYGMEPGDVPVTGDWNRNGRYGVGILRDGSWKSWHLRNSLSGSRGLTVHSFTYGLPTDLPVVGDWNRDGRQTPGLVRDATWFFNNSFNSSSDSSLNFGPR